MSRADMDFSKADAIRLVQDLTMDRIGFDADYPCTYMDLLEKGKYKEYKITLVLDVMDLDLGSTVLEEMEQIGLSRKDVGDIISQIADDAIAEYKRDLADDEQNSKTLNAYSLGDGFVLYRWE